MCLGSERAAHIPSRRLRQAVRFPVVLTRYPLKGHRAERSQERHEEAHHGVYLAAVSHFTAAHNVDDRL